jgi:hypothetical protein
MPMILGQRTVITLLSITFFLLGYYLLMPYFKIHNVTKHRTEESTIRINPLNTKNEFPVNDTIHLQAPASPLTDSDPAGQSLELDPSHSVKIKMYGDRAFLYEQYSFDPSEKVFLVTEFNQLEVGEHDMQVLWNAPNGQLINVSRYNISLTRRSPKHLSYFWLKLMKNGMFTEMMTGDEYKGNIHGRWSAEIYFDGARITTQHFMIYN